MEYYNKYCKCGCGNKIPKKDYHSKTGYTIPDYIAYHYVKVNKNSGMFKKGHNKQCGEKHSRWTGGDIGWWKLYLRKKYNKCCLCKSSKHLCVHHKDQNQKNNVRQNLIVICRSCHNFWHKQAAKDD